VIQMADTHLTEEEIQAAVKVLRSGALRQGPECDAFEHEFASIVGAKYAVSCANGSAALHLAYAAILEPGDEVLVPSFTFCYGQHGDSIRHEAGHLRRGSGKLPD